MQQCCEASPIQARMVVPLLPVSYGLICNGHCGRSIIEHKTVSICDIVSSHMKRPAIIWRGQWLQSPVVITQEAPCRPCIISCQLIVMSTVRVSCFQGIFICAIDKKHDNAINKWSAQWSISTEDDENQKLMFLHLFTELFWDFSSVSTHQNKSRCNIRQSICHIYNIHFEEIYFESVSKNPFLNQS